MDQGLGNYVDVRFPQTVDNAYQKADVVCRSFLPRSPECRQAKVRAYMINQAHNCLVKPEEERCLSNMPEVAKFLDFSHGCDLGHFDHVPPFKNWVCPIVVPRAIPEEIVPVTPPVPAPAPKLAAKPDVPEVQNNLNTSDDDHNYRRHEERMLAAGIIGVLLLVIVYLLYKNRVATGVARP